MNKTGLSIKNLDDEDVKSEDSEIKEELTPEEDFRLCGQQIQQALYAGEEVGDQLYVDLYVAKLRITYTYRDKTDLSSELNEKAKRELELTKILGDLRAEHA